jgi:hypothetical protein
MTAPSKLASPNGMRSAEPSTKEKRCARPARAALSSAYARMDALGSSPVMRSCAPPLPLLPLPLLAPPLLSPPASSSL